MWISANQWGMGLCWVTKEPVMHSAKLLSVNDVTFGSHTMIPEYNATTDWKELSTKGIDRIWDFINVVVKTTKNTNYFWHLSLRTCGLLMNVFVNLLFSSTVKNVLQPELFIWWDKNSSGIRWEMFLREEEYFRYT